MILYTQTWGEKVSSFTISICVLECNTIFGADLLTWSLQLVHFSGYYFQTYPLVLQEKQNKNTQICGSTGENEKTKKCSEYWKLIQPHLESIQCVYLPDNWSPNPQLSCILVRAETPAAMPKYGQSSGSQSGDREIIGYPEGSSLHCSPVTDPTWKVEISIASARTSCPRLKLPPYTNHFLFNIQCHLDWDSKPAAFVSKLCLHCH